jgi:hypothetical protein
MSKRTREFTEEKNQKVYNLAYYDDLVKSFSSLETAINKMVLFVHNEITDCSDFIKYVESKHIKTEDEEKEARIKLAVNQCRDKVREFLDTFMLYQRKETAWIEEESINSIRDNITRINKLIDFVLDSKKIEDTSFSKNPLAKRIISFEYQMLKETTVEVNKCLRSYNRDIVIDLPAIKAKEIVVDDKGNMGIFPLLKEIL